MCKRVRLLAGFFFFAFLFDVVVFVSTVSFLRHVPREAVRAPALECVHGAAAALSALLWWAAKSLRVSVVRLHTTTLVYEVVICFVVATLMYWQYYLDHGVIVPLTWMPSIVIMFPLILPGPPRRMDTAAIVAASMSLLALAILHFSGKVDVGDGSPCAPVRA